MSGLQCLEDTPSFHYVRNSGLETDAEVHDQDAGPLDGNDSVHLLGNFIRH